MKWSKLLCFGLAAALSCASLPQMPAYAQEAAWQEEIPEGNKGYAGEESLGRMVTESEGSAGELEEPLPEALPRIVAGQDTKAANTTEEDFKYQELDDGTLEITEYKGSAEELVVPAEIDGKQVTSIGFRAFDGCSSLTGIQLPKGLTTIGTWAFSGCSSLTGIQLPKGLTTIGQAAFSGCKSLTNIEIPEGLTTIGVLAFYGCKSLAGINVDSGNPIYASQEGILYDKEKKTLLCCPGGKTGNVKLPQGLTTIGQEAFSGCSSLTGIQLPKGLTTIGQNAFYSCRSLTNIEIPEGVTSIEYGAFDGCSSLTGIQLPKGLTTIGQNTFYSCRSLTNIEIPEGVTSIEYGAFSGCSSLTGIQLPKGLTTIGQAAFYGCKSLTGIQLPKGLTAIGQSAFSGCKSLAGINVDSGNPIYASQEGILYDKEKKTLLCCPGGKTGNVKLPQGLTTIGQSAFYGCKSLTGIQLPKGLTTIGQSAFYGCSSLTGIQLPKGLTTIGQSAFSGCKSLTLVVVKGSYAETYAKENGLKYKYACTHNYKFQTSKATTKKNGERSEVCTKCGDIKSKTTIYAAKVIKLSKTSYTYNGKAQKPSVSIKDSKGKALKEKTDYAISYAKGRKNVGVYTVGITFKGNYTGTIKKTFTIAPKPTSISKLAPKKKGFALKWKKQDKQTTGYEIAYSTSKKFTGKTTSTATVGKNKTTSKSIGKLKAKKKYYVRIRTYKDVKTSGKTKKIYSGWSKLRSVTTKK